MIIVIISFLFPVIVWLYVIIINNNNNNNNNNISKSKKIISMVAVPVKYADITTSAFKGEIISTLWLCYVMLFIYDVNSSN